MCIRGFEEGGLFVVGGCGRSGGVVEGEAGGLPFDDAKGEAGYAAAVGLETVDGLHGGDAVGASAIDGELLSFGEGGEVGFEFVEGNGAGLGEVAGGELVGGADVQEDDFAAAGGLQELGGSELEGVVGVGEELADDFAGFGESLFAQLAQGQPELHDTGAGEAVVDETALFVGFNEAGGAEDFEVGAGGGDGLGGGVSQGLDGFFALAEELDHHQAGRVGEGLADEGELF